jgi:hypothetical protein
VVGLAFQYYGTSIAFVTCHYASDSAGRKRVARRNEDAVRTLRSLHLVGDLEEFDLHLQHQHIILLGDLNYRCDAFCEEMLIKVANAVAAVSDGAGAGALHGTTRDQSYMRFHRDPDSKEEATASLSGEYSGGDPEAAPGWVEAWSWSEQVDELSQALSQGRVFFGFQEGRLTFPPSFKWCPGRLVEDFTDVEDLRYAYRTKLEGQASETRPPSWTDRVLFHSLPDLRHRLVLRLYDLCEAIIGSDHRCARLYGWHLRTFTRGYARGPCRF